MNKKAFLIPFIAAATIGFATNAYAYGLGQFFSGVNPSMQSAFGGLTLGAGMLNQNYKEYGSSGSISDKESGSIGYANLTSGWQSSHFGGTFDLGYATGKTNYDGSTWGGTPISSKTDNQILDMSFELRYAFSPTPKLALMPNLIGGLHSWHRSLQSTSKSVGYDEQYGNFYWGAGLTVAYEVTPTVVVSVSGKTGKTSGAQMSTDLGFLSSTQTYDLGSKPWSQVGVAVNWQFSKHVGIYAKATETQFKYGRSATKTNTVYTGGGSATVTSYEPNSKTIDQAVSAGVRIHF